MASLDPLVCLRRRQHTDSGSHPAIPLNRSASPLKLLHNPAAAQIIVSTTLSAFSQVTVPTIGNTDQPVHQYHVGFLGREDDLPFNYWINDSGERDRANRVAYLSGTRLSRFRAGSAHRRSTTTT